MKLRSKWICAGLAAALCCGVSGQWEILGQRPDDLVMVVNKKNAAEVSSAKSILLGETTSWPDKTKVVIALPPSGSSERDAILKRACGMNDTIYTRRLLLATFNGNSAISLREASSAAAVKSFVTANLGAVGFLHRSEVDESVRMALALD